MTYSEMKLPMQSYKTQDTLHTWAPAGKTTSATGQIDAAVNGLERDKAGQKHDNGNVTEHNNDEDRVTFEKAFPGDSFGTWRKIPTSAEDLLCGLAAVTASFEAQFPTTTAPTRDDLIADTNTADFGEEFGRFVNKEHQIPAARAVAARAKGLDITYIAFAFNMWTELHLHCRYGVAAVLPVCQVRFGWTGQDSMERVTRLYGFVMMVRKAQSPVS